MTTKAPRPINESRTFFVGADGCKGGWFAFALADDGQWRTGVFSNIAALWDRYHDASLILLDIPIGLKEAGEAERRCDIEARKILGPDRGRAVFRVPCRQAIYAATYEKAKSINKQLTGKSLPIQTWGIIPKIREADTFLRNTSFRPCIKEIHPEVCFWALAGGHPMKHNKKTAEGYEERLRVLQSYPHVDEIVNEIVENTRENYRRRDVKNDDILDALAAAVTALGSLDALPDPPEFDEKGLPMQMVYRPFIRV